uniref:Integrase catalytic domain-containing protein n=1 Tax=Cyprinus carpio TaxID=7962 RepID=A0A8C2FGW1_CYPCA
MSHTLQKVYQLLGIKRVRTTPYHPQTDGLVERFNQTLKMMLRKYVSDTGKDWDKWLPFLLFAYREVPHASTGFSPFELLYAHHVRGPLDVLRESWEATDKPDKKNILSYVLKMREHLQKTTTLARENLLQSQKRQKEWYDRTARSRTFEPGEKVLLLLPTSEHKLLAKWQGPYQIKRKVGPVTYELEIPSRTQPLQIFHVNMLKKWYARSTQLEPMSEEEAGTATALFVRSVEGEEEIEEQYLPGRQGNSQLKFEHLEDGKRQELLQCIPAQLFMETPGRTSVIHHHITLKDPKPICQPVYRVPERLLPVMREELETMQSLGVI